MQKILVIQCAGKKTQKSWRWRNQHVIFVAHRDKYTKSYFIPCGPDEMVPDSNMTWRRAFLDYYRNKKKSRALDDADELLEAWQLYEHEVYRDLVENKDYGKDKFFILSAGWGLVNADYRLPPYDISFSSKDEYAKISLKELLNRLLPYNPIYGVTNEDSIIYFFGGKKYRRLLYHYTDSILGRKVIFHLDKGAPDKLGAEKQRYQFIPVGDKLKKLGIKVANEKWPYECAKLFINGELNP